MPKKNVEELLAKSVSTDVQVLLSAKENAKRAALDVPSQTNLAALARASKMLESVMQATSNLKDWRAVLAYVADNGRKLGKTKLYNDTRKRRLKKQPDGTFKQRGRYMASLPLSGTTDMVAEKAADQQLQCGTAPSFSALNERLWSFEYATPDGQKCKVRACMIDAMGGRTKEVNSWVIRQRGRVFLWQGVCSLSQAYTPDPQVYFPDARGNKVKIPGSLNLWRCDTTFFKSDLAHKLSTAPDDPGAFHLHSNDAGILEQYAREMCAEVLDDEKQAWENPQGKANHYWDCETMALALAYILNIRHRPRPDGDAEKKTLSRRPMPKSGGKALTDRLANIRR